jgi:hypothetical protein
MNIAVRFFYVAAGVSLIGLAAAAIIVTVGLRNQDRYRFGPDSYTVIDTRTARVCFVTSDSSALGRNTRAIERLRALAENRTLMATACADFSKPGSVLP